MRELWITVPTLVHEELGRKGRDDGQVPALVTHIAQNGRLVSPSSNGLSHGSIVRIEPEYGLAYSAIGRESRLARPRRDHQETSSR